MAQSTSNGTAARASDAVNQLYLHSDRRVQASLLSAMRAGDGSLCDVTLFGVPPAGTQASSLEPIRAHKNILMYASNHFFELLTTSPYRGSNEGEYHLKVVDHLSLQRIVDFIYTDRLAIDAGNAVDILCGVLIGADYLLMKSLVDLCEKFLAGDSQVTSKTCFRLFCFARKYRASTLLHATSTFIAKRLIDLSKDTTFLRMPYHDCAKLFLSEAFVTTDADQRCLAAIAWLENDCVGRATYVHDIVNMIPLTVDSVSLDTIYEAHECDMLRKHAPDTIRKLTAGTIKKIKMDQPVAAVSSYNECPDSWYLVGAYDSRIVKYDTIRRDWSSLPNAAWKRHGFGACGAGDRLVVVGGTDISKKKEFSRDIDEYDLASKTWTTCSTKLTTSSLDSRAFFDGQNVYVLPASGENPFQIYDCKSKKIRELACEGVRQTLYGTSSVLSKNSKCIYVAGGYDCKVNKYDISNNKWVTIGQLNGKRARMAGALSGDDLYLLGGQLNAESAVDTVEIFNVRTGRTRFAQKLPQARHNCAAAIAGNGNIVCVVGGLGGNGNAFREVAVLDKREGKWSTGSLIPDMPVAMIYFEFATI